MSSWPYSTKHWLQLRDLKLSEQPLCEEHLSRGELVAGTEVDHVIPISKGGPPYPDLDGLRVYCKSCHSRKTAVDTGRAKPKGCDANGMPTWAGHHWNKE